jgi:serine/threonine protein kinase
VSSLGKISRFDLLEKIAESPFSVVYRARDPETSSWVAVKVCVATDPALRQRFLRAAESAATLSHPHIARILEFGSGSGRPYLVEEYLEGQDLRGFLRSQVGEPGVREIQMLVQIARGLQYAHRRGVPHQDLKPATVHLESHQEIKLVDFGLARLASAAQALARADRLPVASGYLAPEQAMGLPADERTDIYCFGALAYELLTRHPPVVAENPADLAQKVLSDEPPPVSLSWQDCPAELDALIERCLARSPGERYDSFDDLLLDLVPALEGVRASTTGSYQRTHPGDPSGTVVLVPSGSSLDDTMAIPPAALDPAILAERTVNDTLEDPMLTRVPTASATVVLSPLPSPKLESAPPAVLAPRPAPAPLPPLAVPTAPPPQTARPVAARRRRWGRWLALGALPALVLVGLVAWLAQSGGSPRPAPAPTKPVAASAPAPAPTPRQGLLLIDANPWAKVEAIQDASGRSLPPPTDAATPVAVSLPPGHYVVTLKHPAGSSVRCEADVHADERSLCAVAALPVEPNDYFQAAGWWR